MALRNNTAVYLEHHAGMQTDTGEIIEVCVSTFCFRRYKAAEYVARHAIKRGMWTEYWTDYSILERAQFRMWLIQLPEAYNTKFVIHKSICII
jgi:hypothetical protein